MKVVPLILTHYYICIYILSVKATLLIYYRRYNCYCHKLHSVHVSCAYLVTLISVDLQQLKRKSDGINMVGTACTCTQYLSSTVYCVIEIHINNTPDATYTHTVLLQCYKVARFVTLQQRNVNTVLHCYNFSVCPQNRT